MKAVPEMYAATKDSCTQVATPAALSLEQMLLVRYTTQQMW